MLISRNVTNQTEYLQTQFNCLFIISQQDDLVNIFVIKSVTMIPTYICSENIFIHHIDSYVLKEWNKYIGIITQWKKHFW